MPLILIAIGAIGLAILFPPIILLYLIIGGYLWLVG
jgi:hypothetical protein